MADEEKKSAGDAYEQQFMQGAGSILHRERTVWKMHWMLLFGPILTAFVAGLGFAGVGSKPMPLAVAFALIPLMLLMLALWLSFIALRTVVTTREVIIQYGLWGPKIPVDGIVTCVVKDIPALALGGGIKYVDGAWAYTLFGQGTRVVRIDWKDAKGGTHATIVSSPDPDKLAAVIQRARGAASKGSATPQGPRVGVSAEEMAAAEAEAEAVLAEEQAKAEKTS